MGNKRKKEVENEEVQQAEEGVEQEEDRYTLFDEMWGDSQDDKDVEGVTEDTDTDIEENDEDEDHEEVDSEDSADDHDDEPEDSDDDDEVDDDPAETRQSKSRSNDPYAWIEELPEEVKQQAEALRHSATSHQGRAVAFQRRLGELQQELDELRTSRERKPADQKSGSKSVASDSAAPELPEEWKKLQEDFPEFAAAVESLRKIDREQYEAKLTEVLSPIEKQRVAQQREVFDNKVTEGSKAIFTEGDDWHEIVTGDDFLAWLEMQPKSMRQAARTPDPDEALYVLRRYKQDYDEAVAHILQEEGLSPDDKTTKASAKPNKADEVKSRRSKRKKESVAPESKPVSTTSERVSGDHEALFNSMWG